MKTDNIWYNTIIYFIGQNITSIVGILLIPLYTKYLNPKDYGVYSVIFVIINLSSIIIDFGLASSFSIRFYKISLTIRAAYINKIFYAYIISLIFFGVLFYYFGDKVFNLGDLSNRNLLLVIVLIIFFNLHFAFLTNLLRIEGLAKFYVVLTSISSIFLSTLNILFIVHFKFTYKAYLLSYLINGILFYIIALIYICRKYKISYTNFKINSILPLFVIGIPMLVSLLTSQILTTGDQYLLGIMSSFNDAGIYAVGYKMGMLFYSFIIISFFQAYPPEAYRIYGENLILFKEKQIKALNIFNLLIVVLSLLFLLLLPFLFSLLVNSKYILSLQIIPIILLSYILLGYANLFTVILLIQEKTKILMILTLVATIINTLLNVIFIPKFTFWAAAVSTLIGYLFFLILSYRASQKVIYINYQIKNFVLSLALIVFACVMDTIFYHIFNDFTIITLINSLLIVGVIIFITIKFDVKKYYANFYFKNFLHQIGFSRFIK